MSTIAIVSPGAMGSGLGRCWQAAGHRVVATLAGRSARTAGLAEGLELLADLEEVVAAADLVVTVCPPGQAEEVLEAVLACAGRTGAAPVVLDANALSPASVTRLVRVAAAAGLRLVDGAVSGGPPRPEDDPTSGTMLYLSGAGAHEVADLARRGFRTRVVGPEPGQASGVKMCTASVSKGTHAVWLQALETARALGVTDVVLDDLAEAEPNRTAHAAATLASAGAKSARFVAEMEQIAATQAAAGASPELFAAMATVYARVATTELATLTPEQARGCTDLGDVLARLSRPGPGGSPPPTRQ